MVLAGSRAHSPTLRIRLLSPNHAAAISAKEDEKQRNNNVFRGNQVHNMEQRNFVATMKFDRSRAVKEMEAVAGVKDDAQTSQERRKSSKKRGTSSVSEVIWGVKRLKGAGQFFISCAKCGQMYLTNVLLRCKDALLMKASLHPGCSWFCVFGLHWSR